MNYPRLYGRPTDLAGVYAVGGGDWVITWSPERIHPYAALWLEWAARFGPNPATLPDPDVWHYSLFTKDIS